MVKQKVSGYKKRDGTKVRSYNRKKRRRLKSKSTRTRISDYRPKYKRKVNAYGEFV